MRTVPLRELQRFVRETVVKSLIERIQGKDMPSGSSWHVAGKGWAGKNRNGVIDYFYGPDVNKNKMRADAFSKDVTKKPEPKPTTSSGIEHPTKEATKFPNESVNEDSEQIPDWIKRTKNPARRAGYTQQWREKQKEKERNKPPEKKESVSEASKYEYRIGGDGEGRTFKKGNAKRKVKSKKATNVNTKTSAPNSTEKK